MDAAIFQEQQAIGVGMILRNKMGHAVGCNLQRTNGLCLPKEAKPIYRGEGSNNLAHIEICKLCNCGDGCEDGS